jgi:hypothetical protein
MIYERVGAVHEETRAVLTWFAKAKDALIKKARELAPELDGKTGMIPFYQMSTKYKFADLADRLSAL